MALACRAVWYFLSMLVGDFVGKGDASEEIGGRLGLECGGVEIWRKGRRKNAEAVFW